MIRIRPFLPGDEAAVRRICFDTALFGEPMDVVFDNGLLITDVLIGCHVWTHPELLYVAEIEGRVAGYLAGCLDARHHYRRCAWRLGRRLLYSWVAHGHWLRPRSWRLAVSAGRYARAAAPWFMRSFGMRNTAVRTGYT